MSLCDKCVHRNVCGNEDAREEAVKVCDDFIDKSLLSIPESERGEWIEKEMFDGDTAYECSKCRELFCLIDGTPADNLYNFCPNCGADMRGENNC